MFLRSVELCSSFQVSLLFTGFQAEFRCKELHGIARNCAELRVRKNVSRVVFSVLFTGLLYLIRNKKYIYNVYMKYKYI